MVDIIHRNDFVKLRITITALEENNLTNVYITLQGYFHIRSTLRKSKKCNTYLCSKEHKVQLRRKWSFGIISLPMVSPKFFLLHSYGTGHKTPSNWGFVSPNHQSIIASLKKLYQSVLSHWCIWLPNILYNERIMQPESK